MTLELQVLLVTEYTVFEGHFSHTFVVTLNRGVLTGHFSQAKATGFQWGAEGGQEPVWPAKGRFTHLFVRLLKY